MLKRPVVSYLREVRNHQFQQIITKLSLIQSVMSEIQDARFEAAPQDLHIGIRYSDALNMLKTKYEKGTQTEKLALQYIENYQNQKAVSVDQLDALTFEKLCSALDKMTKDLSRQYNKDADRAEEALSTVVGKKRVCPF